REEIGRLYLFSLFTGGQISLSEIEDETVNGKNAELELTVQISVRNQTLSQKDVAVLVIEDGAWKLADHFIQTLETATGLAPAPTIPARAFGPDGCLKGDPLAGVWLPSLLKVLDPSVTV